MNEILYQILDVLLITYVSPPTFGIPLMWDINFAKGKQS